MISYCYPLTLQIKSSIIIVHLFTIITNIHRRTACKVSTISTARRYSKMARICPELSFEAIRWSDVPVDIWIRVVGEMNFKVHSISKRETRETKPAKLFSLMIPHTGKRFHAWLTDDIIHELDFFRTANIDYGQHDKEQSLELYVKSSRTNFADPFDTNRIVKFTFR